MKKLNAFLGGQLVLSLSLSLPAAIGNAQEWRSITDPDLKIVEGSPLDFSQLLPTGFAGQHGRLIVGSKGRMVFEHKPDEPAKLQCGSLGWSPATGGFPDHDTAREYVKQLKRHGYNLVRFHYVEGTLMHRKTVDNDFDVDQLDRFHFFLSELKNAGIYWMMDMMSSENGTIGDTKPNRWEETRNLKFRVHFEADPDAKQAWKDQVAAIYAGINPYTHQSILSDPALASVVLVNENSVDFLESLSPPRITAASSYHSSISIYRPTIQAMRPWPLHGNKAQANCRPMNTWRSKISGCRPSANSRSACAPSKPLSIKWKRHPIHG